MPKLLLLRHLQSQWNKENKFAGWTQDVPLSKEGILSAGEISQKIGKFKIDKVYTSPLKRNKDTVELTVKDKKIPVIVDSALDERDYGRITGLNKDEVKKQYGEECVHLWRRSWNVAPPGGESLEDVYERAVSFFKKNIEKDLKGGKNVLVVASHNSLRALVKYVENIPHKDIINLEIPYAGLSVYEFNKDVYKKQQ